MPVNTLVLGGGGREHALIYALSRSNEMGELHCAPGNPGTSGVAQNHRIDPCDADAVVSLCAERQIGLIVIGPEAPLVAGVADRARAAGISVFGPGKDGARLEGSKVFAKEFMRRNGIPTAPFDVCYNIDECIAALSARKPPFVIKADGLAAGKGVFLPNEAEDARLICLDLLNGKLLGGAGRVVIIEDYMPGCELTVCAVTDGKSFALLPVSRDHKRIFDGDNGPNTGGMGAYAPVTLPAGVMERVAGEILRPTLSGLASESVEYRGVLYMGLMLDGGGGAAKISVVEYNSRFGDPETQAMIPLIKGDFGRLIRAAADGALEGDSAVESEGSALCVVLASGGYPGDFMKGVRITGIDNKGSGDVHIFHSGTASDGKGNIVTNGGRVLSVVGTGPTLYAAHKKAYKHIESLSFNNMHYRRDIGRSELKENGREIKG